MIFLHSSARGAVMQLQARVTVQEYFSSILKTCKHHSRPNLNNDLPSYNFLLYFTSTLSLAPFLVLGWRQLYWSAHSLFLWCQSPEIHVQPLFESIFNPHSLPISISCNQLLLYLNFRFSLIFYLWFYIFYQINK